MSSVDIPAQQRMILDGVSWARYRGLLRELSDRRLHLTYDRGILEIMTISHEREVVAAFLGRLVVTLTEELHLPIHEGRSTTLRRKGKQKGLSPDNSYWIAHEAEVRALTRIDLRTDPPPDLAIEVDLAGSTMNRMGIYADLGVPEVWRHNAQGLAFFTLNAERRYALAAESSLFSVPITPLDLMSFLQDRVQMDANAVIRRFREWIGGRCKSSRRSTDAERGR